MFKYAALAIGMMAATPSAAFLATNNLTVQGQGAMFQVDYFDRSGARDFWCAAGDFAERHLNLRTGTMLYRVSPPPRGAGEGVAFSTDAARSSGRSGLLRLTTGDPGGMTVARARQYCNDRQYR